MKNLSTQGDTVASIYSKYSIVSVICFSFSVTSKQIRLSTDPNMPVNLFICHPPVIELSVIDKSGFVDAVTYPIYVFRQIKNKSVFNGAEIN